MMKNHFQIDALVKPFFISSKKGFNNLKVFCPLILLFLSLFISSCSSSNITYDYDHTQIFKEYKLYKFIDYPEFTFGNSFTLNTTLYKNIKIAVIKEFKKKGFTLVENGKQDFNILIRRDLIPQDSLYKFHPWWLPCGSTSVDIFEDNSLVIDITDKGNSLAWRGLAPKFFKSYSNTKYLQNELDNVVSEILDGFPPN